MAESSGFFNAELVNGKYDREYLAKHFAKYFSLFIANGVFPNPSDGLQLFENTTADMNVLMHPGYGWINGYWYGLDGNLTLAIEPADGVLNRIDSIMVRWDQEQRKITAKVIKGTPASQPTAPSVTRNADFYDLCVAQIRVDAGTTKIMQSMITDTRMNSSLCGIVTGVVKSIDTTTLFEQYQAALREFQNTRMKDFDEWQAQEKSDFDTWFATIQDILDKDTAGNLLNLITKETEDRKASDAALEGKIGINGTAVYEESTVKITAPAGVSVVTFLTPSDCKAGDKYTLNGTSLTLTDLNGNPVKNGWKQGAPVTLSISGSTAYFAAGPQASLQTVKTTTSWAKKSTSAGTQYWEQPVTVPGLTAQAQVDIALDADGLNRLLTDGVSALWAENNMGNLTVKTLDAAPTAALTLYLTITEVSV